LSGNHFSDAFIRSQVIKKAGEVSDELAIRHL